MKSFLSFLLHLVIFYASSFINTENFRKLVFKFPVNFSRKFPQPLAILAARYVDRDKALSFSSASPTDFSLKRHTCLDRC